MSQEGGATCCLFVYPPRFPVGTGGLGAHWLLGLVQKGDRNVLASLTPGQLDRRTDVTGFALVLDLKDRCLGSHRSRPIGRNLPFGDLPKIRGGLLLDLGSGWAIAGVCKIPASFPV